MEVVESPLDDEGYTDVEALAAMVDDDTAAVFVQQPNFLGTVEDLGALVGGGQAHRRPVVCAADPMPLSILKPPGELGVDLCVGEGQTLGNRLDFGGPSFGFFAAAERFIRKMPGRIAGETRDVDGRRGFVLTLQTREQHIRREKATHNICTAQALNALAGVIYLSWLGKRGFVELGELLAAPHALRARGAWARGDQPRAGGARVRRARARPAGPPRPRPRGWHQSGLSASAAITPNSRTGSSSQSQNGAQRSTSIFSPRSLAPSSRRRSGV